MMRALTCLFAFASATVAAEDGFTSLFDGRSLNGWTISRPHGVGYLAQEGKIVCPKDGGGNLFTEKEYSDFVLRFEFRFEAGGNNGVGIRSPLQGDAAYTGMEIQILDHDHAMYKGKIKPSQHHGAVYDMIAPIADAQKPAMEWNTEEIHVQGKHVRVTLNGKLITDADLSTVTDPAVLKRHPGVLRTNGHVGWLGHGSLVEFRNIRIKEL